MAAALVVFAGIIGWIAIPTVVIRTPTCAASVKPNCLTAAERLTAVNDVRSSVLEATTAVLFLATAAFSVNSVLLTREANDVSRFTAAVELLNSDRPEGSLGGVLALGHHLDVIQDRQPIGALLASFVRRIAPPPQTDMDPNGSDVEPLEARSPRVHYALRLLGRSDVPTESVDLTNIDARRAELSGLTFRGANLTDSVFNASHLVGCDLRGCRLTEADLRYADLREARLEGADMTGAHIEAADLSTARIDASTVLKDVTSDDRSRLPRNWHAGVVNRFWS